MYNCIQLKCNVNSKTNVMHALKCRMYFKNNDTYYLHVLISKFLQQLMQQIK